MASIPLFLMCVMICSKWSLENNHIIAGLVSILLTRVLGDDRLHLLQHINRPKGKAYIWNLGVNENQPYLTIEISLDDLITKLAQNILTTGVYLTIHHKKKHIWSYLRHCSVGVLFTKYEHMCSDSLHMCISTHVHWYTYVLNLVNKQLHYNIT